MRHSYKCAIGHSKNEKLLKSILPILSSKVGNRFLENINPTLNYQIGDVGRLPLVDTARFEDGVIQQVSECINISKKDWDSFETSWDFSVNPLVENGENELIESSYQCWRAKSQQAIIDIKECEEAINRHLIDAYGLQNELTPEVLLSEITLTVNPIYRYGSNVKEQDLERRFQYDAFSDLISYSIGCMLGRYSLDREGLVYAHRANEGFDQLVAEGAYKTFSADEDGIIPLTDQEWFKDDATNRFREFVQVVWGEEHLQENLDFVAESLCLNAIKPKKSESALETIRRYLSTQFYKDHLKTYKKRPIYWLFSSGKQKAFECLVYLHRYNEGTLSRMRTEYVTPLLGKYDAYAEQLEKQIETADSTSEANRFKKELDALIKKQVELREFDDKLKHYADMRISLDLDDGVKVNYGKFGDLLADVKAITGSAPEVN